MPVVGVGISVAVALGPLVAVALGLAVLAGLVAVALGPAVLVVVTLGPAVLAGPVAVAAGVVDASAVGGRVAARVALGDGAGPASQAFSGEAMVRGAGATAIRSAAL